MSTPYNPFFFPEEHRWVRHQFAAGYGPESGPSRCRGAWRHCACPVPDWGDSPGLGCPTQEDRTWRGKPIVICQACEPAEEGYSQRDPGFVSQAGNHCYYCGRFLPLHGGVHMCPVVSDQPHRRKS